jgi:myosin-5
MKATVGGQFRRQLRDLRTKIDKTSPHYVRCLKPNDHLVADEFDAVVVAEQLRCGGILEAVRVSRAGFPQHYPHAEFFKRYRCVATKDLKKSGIIESSISPRPTWAAPTPQKKWQPPRGGAFRGAYPTP